MSEVSSTKAGAADFDAFYAAEAFGQVRRAALLTGSDELANDIVHAALTAMWQRWGSFDDPGPYLNRAVLNGCRDAGRRHVTYRGLVARLVAARSNPDALIDGPDYLIDALIKLPFNQRAAVVLRYYAGHTTDEIAAALNCPAGSVGPWISRALQTLRKELQ